MHIFTRRTSTPLAAIHSLTLPLMWLGIDCHYDTILLSVTHVCDQVTVTCWNTACWFLLCDCEPCGVHHVNAFSIIVMQFK